MSSYTRVLVKLHKRSDSASPRLARFTECILKYFDFPYGSGHVHIQMKGSHLTVSDSKLTEQDEILIKHPVFCPVLSLPDDIANSLPEETCSRGVDVGAAIVLESCDGKILFSRRATHLRIFPGLWVFPGGHVEENESLLDAGLRELQEETGLSLKHSDCVGEKIDLLTLWESVYPAKLSSGPPKRHHIVAYFHARAREGLTADLLESRINFDPNEVGACAWLDRQLFTSVAESFDEEHDESVINDHHPSFFRAVTLDENNKQCIKDLPTAPLFRVMSEDGSDQERVSTGTKFAVQRFLQLQSTS